MAARERGVFVGDLHAVAKRNGLKVGIRTFGDCLRMHRATR
jgi:hypothetical protein